MHNDKIWLVNLIVNLIEDRVAEQRRAAMIAADQVQSFQDMTALTVQIVTNGGDHASLGQELTARLHEILAANGHEAAEMTLAANTVDALLAVARGMRVASGGSIAADNGDGRPRRPGTTIRSGAADPA